MAINYPAGQDDNTTLKSDTNGNTDTTASVPHDVNHNNANAAIKAIETKLGTGATTPTTAGQVLRFNGANSLWQLLSYNDLANLPPLSGINSGDQTLSLTGTTLTISGANGNSVTLPAGGGGTASSPLTTKGDIWGFSTADTRIPVGADSTVLTADSTQPLGVKWAAAGTGSGSVSSVSVVSTNGLAGTVATATTTPAITLSTTVTGVLKGNGTAISTATAGTDYVVPSGSITGNAATATKLATARTIAGTSFDGTANVILTNKFIVQGTTDTGLTGAQFLGALATGILKVTTTTGVLTTAVAADFPTLNQNTTGTAANVTGTVAIANGGTGATTAAAARTALGAAASGSNADITALTASPVITTGTVTADPNVSLGIASKQYVDKLGTTSLIRNETPGGLINSSNTAYTTASTYATGSLKVYLNGQRLTPGASNDYVEAGQGFTMQYAPATGDVLLVDYETTNTVFIQGSNSSTVQENPTGLVNGSNTIFTTLLGKYVANSLEVFINGLAQKRGTDYTETTPSSGTFTFAVAPLTGDIVAINYQFSTGASGNADTVDGFHANSTPTASTILPLDSTGKLPTSLSVSVRQSGWFYTTISSPTTTTSVSITFPTAFTSAPKVTLGLLGFKTGTTPTSVSDFSGAYSGTTVTIFATGITATGFTCNIIGTSAFGVSFNGFTWIAEI